MASGRLGGLVAAALCAVAGVPSTAIGAVERSNVPGLSNAKYMDAFVKREGSKLTVAGRPFRFSGANIEWLGLSNYGPNNSKSIPAGSQRYPTKYEVDDALATAHEMGATTVRIQTLGDSVGCPKCLEPKLGQFNDAAFAQLDMVVAEARRYGIKLWGEFSGDANSTAPAGKSNFQSSDWYCLWRARSECNVAFFTDPDLIGDYERHMKAVLDHVNTITGVAYKDDPTFIGWVDANNLNLLNAVPPPIVERWLATVSAYFKSIAAKHLFLDISLTGGDATVTPTVLQIPGIDVYGQEYYPHWFPGAQGGTRAEGSAPLLHQEAQTVADAGKAYATIEYGWDHTDFLTTDALDQFLTGLRSDPNVDGDGAWALLAHADSHGWQPIPADTGCSPSCETLEDGNWWALYYTGATTLSNGASDMAARAQLLRAHAYRLAGFKTVPSHETVPAPVITSTGDGKVVFQGAAGSPRYSVQRRSGSSWTTVCDRCTTDADGGWKDPSASSGCYRVAGVNLDGVPGPWSTAAGGGCTAIACRSRRSVRFTLPAGASRALVTVDGRARALRRRGRTVLVSLRGLPRRAVVVHIRARLHGRTYSRTSTLHPCA
jgi:hypothetical protein